MKLAVVVLGLVVACGKSAPTVVLSQDETKLMSHLPKGSLALFGGNYMKLQNYFATTPLARVMQTVEKTTPGFSEWVACWSSDMPALVAMGNVVLEQGMVELQYVMSGVDVAALARCSDRAKFVYAIDPDGK